MINVSLLTPSSTGYLFAHEFIYHFPTYKGVLTKNAVKRIKNIMRERGYKIANWYGDGINQYIVLNPEDWDLLEAHNNCTRRKKSLFIV